MRWGGDREEEEEAGDDDDEEDARPGTDEIPFKIRPPGSILNRTERND